MNTLMYMYFQLYMANIYIYMISKSSAITENNL